MQISTWCSTLRLSFGLIGVESASTASSSLRRSYEEQLSCGESLWRGQTRGTFFKKMKTEQDATDMFGHRHWLNMHLMLTRGPVAGAWATLRMRRQNLPRPGWVKHRRMCELAISSPLFFFVHYPLVGALGNSSIDWKRIWYWVSNTSHYFSVWTDSLSARLDCCL